MLEVAIATLFKGGWGDLHGYQTQTVKSLPTLEN